MYAIYIQKAIGPESERENGYLKGVMTTNVYPTYVNPVNKYLSVQPILSQSKYKTWKTERGAKAFAINLSQKLAKASYFDTGAFTYRYSMKYNIQVMNLDTNVEIFKIYSYTNKLWSYNKH